MTLSKSEEQKLRLGIYIYAVFNPMSRQGWIGWHSSIVIIVFFLSQNYYELMMTIPKSEQKLGLRI